MNSRQNQAMEPVGALLREQYGRLVRPVDDVGYLVSFPNQHPYGVAVMPHAESDGHEMLSVLCPIFTDVAQCPNGMSEFLLREAADLKLGRFAYADATLMLEHPMFSAEVTAERLTAVVNAIAQTAEGVALTLARAGALPVDEQEED